MKKRIEFFPVLFFATIVGCGGAAQESETETISEPIMPVEEVVEAPAVAEPQRPAAIQRTAGREDEKKCRVEEIEEGVIQVVSDMADWFLHVTPSSQVECGTFGGKVKITDGNLTIKVESLVPNETAGDIEAELRDQAARFIKSEMAEKYGSGSNLEFTETKVGKKKRKALCVEANLDLKGMAGKIAACVTSKQNINDEIIVHRVYWVGPESEFTEADAKRVKEEASNWFRYSDTDMTGKILNVW
ncbi:MAG: hypothetical protein JXX29_01385 [Deltaproteobacteria bacterium]|nr:hypothetical protein [Deltaproteobacteria bacterium]MBN2670292.1 hypothetical protein [Deltaproteobacteria bacterium]